MLTSYSQTDSFRFFFQTSSRWRNGNVCLRPSFTPDQQNQMLCCLQALVGSCTEPLLRQRTCSPVGRGHLEETTQTQGLPMLRSMAQGSILPTPGKTTVLEMQ